MRKLQCDPASELIGQNMMSILNNLQADEIQPYLEKHGLTNLKPDQWYPTQRFLDVFNDMSEDGNLSSNLIAVGMQIVQQMMVPPEMVSLPLPAILDGWDNLYQLQHRNANIGYVKVERLSDTHYKTYHKHIYPDDMTYGVAYGLAKRWLPSGTPFKVYYDPDVPILDKGGDITIIHVEW